MGIILNLLADMARGFYRKREVAYLRGKITSRHEAWIGELLNDIGWKIKDTSPSFSAIRQSYCRSVGYGDLDIGANGQRAFCSEAPIIFSVYLGGFPAFMLGGEFRGDVFCIRQLQGALGVAIPPELKHWPRLLVEACMESAEQYGIPEIRLYRAHQTLFYRMPVFEGPPQAISAYRQRMRRRYDGTARQLGFTMKRDWGEWKNPAYERPSV
ncbi:MAG TPA: hypothetical protein VHC20_03750 [Candidatus Paceibacterota bacterium]|nr:hypothetical protein [Candidatus Paceibacterota bacterium]